MNDAGAVVVLGLVALACRPAPPPVDESTRYLVTSEPIDVGVGPGLCVAIDPRDPHGVWWWQPGASGCASRSTGPDVFHAQEATVKANTSTTTSVGFRLGTHSTTRPFVDVRLMAEAGRLRAIDTGAQVALGPRADLAIPEWPPRH